MAKKKTGSVLAKVAARVGRTLGTAARKLAPGARGTKAAMPAVKPVAAKAPRAPNTPVPQKVKRGQVVDERALARSMAAGSRWSNRKPR